MTDSWDHCSSLNHPNPSQGRSLSAVGDRHVMTWGILSRWPLVLCGLLAIATLAGCAAKRRTVPARSIPSESCQACDGHGEPINFLTLRQDPPKHYRVASRDVLGVYIEDILGDRQVPPPVHFPTDASQQPAVGYPTPIRDDGTISLPLIEPIFVEGQTVPEVEQTILKRYRSAKILLPEQRQRIIVTLMKRRTYQVVVVREDQGVPLANVTSESMIVGTNKRGMAYAVDLPAYENDVLHALTETGGLPGNDAKNELVVLRGGFDPERRRQENFPLLVHPVSGEEVIVDGEIVNLDGLPARVHPIADSSNDNEASLPEPAKIKSENVKPIDESILSENATLEPLPSESLIGPNRLHESIVPQDGHGSIVRIPLRSGRGVTPTRLEPSDVILKTGDIVFVQSREKEVFYTGGLLPGGQHPLPRDYPIDILEAIAMAGASVGQSLGGSGPSSGVNTGTFPATKATVLRRRGHQQIPIEVDLRRAFHDPRERIQIEPGDFISLEYRGTELVSNLLMSSLRFSWFIGGGD